MPRQRSTIIVGARGDSSRSAIAYRCSLLVTRAQVERLSFTLHYPKQRVVIELYEHCSASISHLIAGLRAQLSTSLIDCPVILISVTVGRGYKLPSCTEFSKHLSLMTRIYGFSAPISSLPPLPRLAPYFQFDQYFAFRAHFSREIRVKA